MRGEKNLSDNEWIELGQVAKSIRNCIMDFCVLSCNRFGTSSKMYKSFKTLDTHFLRLRSKLDDYVCGAYPLTHHSIGPDRCSLTGVFFGDSNILSNTFGPRTVYKRGELPMSFDAAQQQVFASLLANIEHLLTSIDQHPYIVRRFKEKEASARLKRFKKSVQATKHLVEQV